MSLSTTRNSPLGQSLRNFAPGFAIRGVIIDNPSGWWLQIQPGGYYIPPFTFGWRTALNGVLSISVNAVQGPGALASTNVGEAITVTVTEEETDNWNGYTTLGPGAITADLIAAGVVIVGTINEVTNDGATVVIDINGITITDGFLILQDEFGSTVLSGGGFSGSWTQYVNLGLYNAAFLNGVAGTVPVGRTVSLPYWTVADVNAGATLTFLNPGVSCVFGAVSDEKEIASDLVAVAPGEDLEVKVAATIARSAGTLTLEVELILYDETQTFFSGIIIIDKDFTANAAFATYRAFTGVGDGFYYAQVVVRFRETVAHNAANKISLWSVSLLHGANNDDPVVNVRTSSGTWTKPENLRYIIVECVGGGGGGGGCQATAANESSAAGGGGGGGYSRALILASALTGTSYTVTVGAAGGGAAAGNNTGSNGGNTSFSGSGITTVQANGGAGGNGSAANTGPERNNGGIGGTATGGDVNIEGDPGQFGVVTRGDGGQGDPSQIGNGGAAAGSLGGGGGRGSASSGAGFAGGTYGGGGAGGWNANSQASGRAGGDGAAGVVVITEFYGP